MSTIDAWKALLNLSNGNTWVKIPGNIANVLGIDSRIGIAGGILCTQSAAIGAERFITRLNSIGNNR